MLSYSYLPSKGLAVFHKWEGSQSSKLMKSSSQSNPPSPVHPRPSRLQRQGKQFPLPHRHNAVSSSHMHTCGHNNSKECTFPHS